MTKIASSPTTSHSFDATPSQKPSAPSIQSYLLPNSQGVRQPTFSGKPYVPSKGVQKLTQYLGGRKTGGTGIGGSSGKSTSQISGPAADKLLDDEIDSTSERWSDRFSFVAKDSYGNLRCVFYYSFSGYEIIDVGPQFHRGDILDDVR